MFIARQRPLKYWCELFEMQNCKEKEKSILFKICKW